MRFFIVAALTTCFLTSCTKADVPLLPLKDQPIILVFSAPYCHACQIAKKELKEIQKSGQLTDIRVTVIDIQKNDKLAKKYNVRVIPTIFVGLIKIRLRTHNMLEAVKEAIILRNEKIKEKLNDRKRTK